MMGAGDLVMCVSPCLAYFLLVSLYDLAWLFLSSRGVTAHRLVYITICGVTRVPSCATLAKGHGSRNNILHGTLR